MEHDRKPRGPSDATDYSSTQAPATQKYAEGRRPHPSDERLEPGGPRGTDQDTGIADVDRDGAEAGGSEQTDIGATKGDR